jgi:dTDP-4-amino-4,6-dideoxygalactose transaminase
MSWGLPLTSAALSQDDVDAYVDCLRGGWLTMGPRVQEFEHRFRDTVGSGGCLAVSSGTAGLQLALLALGVGGDDEVVLPAFTFVAAANAVCAVGAQPVFCDAADELDPVLDCDTLANAISARTKAVVLTHPFGFPAPSEAVRKLCREHEIRLVEDCTSALGTRILGTERWAGTVGDVGVFSFRSSGPLPLGEGGMVVCDDDTVADRVRLLRSHAMTSVTWDRHRGHATSYDVVDIGFNYRLDEPRSALGLRRLASLDADVKHRRGLALRYREGLRDVSQTSSPWSDEAVRAASPWGFVIVADDRDGLRRRLAEAGIQSSAQPAVIQLSRYRAAQAGSSFPRAERFADRHCVVPLSSTTTAEDVDAVVAALDA